MSTTAIYHTSDITSPTAAQQNFAQHREYVDPMQAMTSYARTMHEHTKHQMESATRPSRRRSPQNAAVDAMNSHGLLTESSASSISSHAS
ncbi:MAG: hypothetical protein M1834_005070 [Cirrosporium novae-zelandiae]|nr:MAG: hypothetical protein M1834_005070 [Cirrosporium novae-zelandiae]